MISVIIKYKTRNSNDLVSTEQGQFTIARPV